MVRAILFRPALRLFLRNVQESVLSEAKARPPENVASPSYRFVVPRDQTSDANTKLVGHFSDRR